MIYYNKKKYLLLVFLISVIFFLNGCFEPKLKFIREFGVEGNGPGEFKNPTDIAVNSKGEIIVCDTGNNRVVMLNSNCEYIRTLSGGVLKLNEPYGVCVDNKDNIYVADTGNNRIIKYSPLGNIMLEITSTAKLGQLKDDTASIKRPYDVAVLEDKKIFVIDSLNRILIFEPTGVCSSRLGTKGSSLDSFNMPTRIAIVQPSESDKNYYIYVADSFNTRVIKFSSEHKPVYEIKDKGLLDYIRDPRGLATLPDKSIVVSDCGAIPICVYSSTGVFEASGGSFGVGRGKIMSAAGVAVDVNRKRLYVSDYLQNKILIFALHKDFKVN